MSRGSCETGRRPGAPDSGAIGTDRASFTMTRTPRRIPSQPRPFAENARDNGSRRPPGFPEISGSTSAPGRRSGRPSPGPFSPDRAAFPPTFVRFRRAPLQSCPFAGNSREYGIRRPRGFPPISPIEGPTRLTADPGRPIHGPPAPRASQNGRRARRPLCEIARVVTRIGPRSRNNLISGV